MSNNQGTRRQTDRRSSLGAGIFSQTRSISPIHGSVSPMPGPSAPQPRPDLHRTLHHTDHRTDHSMPLGANFYITRESGAKVPLVALDELPVWIQVDGVPRVLGVWDMANSEPDLTYVGHFPHRNRFHTMEVLEHGRPQVNTPTPTLPSRQPRGPPPHVDAGVPMFDRRFPGPADIAMSLPPRPSGPMPPAPPRYYMGPPAGVAPPPPLPNAFFPGSPAGPPPPVFWGPPPAGPGGPEFDPFARR